MCCNFLQFDFFTSLSLSLSLSLSITPTLVTARRKENIRYVYDNSVCAGHISQHQNVRLRVLDLEQCHFEVE